MSLYYKSSILSQLNAVKLHGISCYIPINSLLLFTDDEGDFKDNYARIVIREKVIKTNNITIHALKTILTIMKYKSMLYTLSDCSEQRVKSMLDMQELSIDTRLGMLTDDLRRNMLTKYVKPIYKMYFLDHRVDIKKLTKKDYKDIPEENLDHLTAIYNESISRSSSSFVTLLRDYVYVKPVKANNKLYYITAKEFDEELEIYMSSYDPVQDRTTQLARLDDNIIPSDVMEMLEDGYSNLLSIMGKIIYHNNKIYFFVFLDGEYSSPVFIYNITSNSWDIISVRHADTQHINKWFIFDNRLTYMDSGTSTFVSLVETDGNIHQL